MIQNLIIRYSSLKKFKTKCTGRPHGYTAAELIYQRVDVNQKNMGITNYAGNSLLKRDVEVAKNYLNEDELAIFNHDR